MAACVRVTGIQADGELKNSCWFAYRGRINRYFLGGAYVGIQRFGGWARLMRTILGAEAPPTEVEVKEASPYKEVDILAAIKANRMLRGIVEILRPR